jgi:cytochrome c oxidase subunit 2
MSMLSVTQLEKRIIWIALAFAVVLLGLSALAINLFHVGLPSCLTDVKPFQKGELITHSPTHYELHYVARMWKFEPEDVTVPAGSTVDIYLSAADVTHGLILLGTNLNLMAVPGVVNYARVKFDQPRVYQLLGLYGRAEKLRDGSTVTVNDAFIREKILHPDAKIVAGRFEQEMPKTDLTQEEIEEIIEYIQTLK